MVAKTVRACVLLLAVCLTGGLSGGSEAGEVRKISDVVIYQDDRFYSAFPSLVLRPDGEVLCAFRRAPNRPLLWGGAHTHTDPNSYLVLVRSKDGGRTWSTEPELIYAHPLGGSQDPCMVQLKDGSIVCTSYGWALLPPEGVEKLKNTLSHSPFGFLGGYIMRSENGGKSWDGPFIPMTLPGNISLDATGSPLPAYNRGDMIQRKDGKLYWAVARHDRLQANLTSVHLIASSDGGRTWEYLCPIATDDKVSFNETCLIETRDGDIVAFMRTAGLDGRTAVARSTDGGRSFAKWQDAGFFGYPHHAVHLRDGRVLLVYGYRQPPYGIRTRVLDPECANIGQAREFVIRDDAGDTDIGYPWAVVLPDGKVLVAYYFNLKDGVRHIAGSLLSVE